MKYKAETKETKIEIKYIPGNTESMRNALITYKNLIDSGEAFEDSYCIAHFLPQEQGNISIFDYKSTLAGETLFFKYAVEILELKKDLIETFESIVSYSRKLNDSSEMWLTDEMPFAANALDYFINKYPEYGYLLASFLVPYWDDEHMSEPLFLLGTWSDKLGVTKDTLKAFCYCDNSDARKIMLGYDPYDSIEVNEKLFSPIQYLREDPKHFQEFKDILIERFKNMPYLQYTDDERYYDENPLKNFILDMLYQEYPYDIYDDNFDKTLWLTNTFVNKSAEEEILDLKIYIENILKTSIVLDKSEYFKKLKKNEYKNPPNLRKKSEYEKWEELILNIYPNGKKLWEYIIFGTNNEVLEEVLVLDIINEGLLKKCELAKEFQDTYCEDLIDIIHIFIKSFMKERIFKLKLTNDNEILRLYDVLHLSLNKLILTENIIDTLNESSTNVNIFNRYQVDTMKMIKYKLSSLKKRRRYTSNFIKDQLFSIYNLVQKNRIQFKNELENDFINKEYSNYIDSTFLSSYTLAGAYILLKDEENNIEDDLTNFLKIYVETNSISLICNFLKNNEFWHSSHLYLPIEKFLIDGKFESYSYKNSFKEALLYLKNNLAIDQDEKINKNQEYYLCFSSNKDFSFEIIITYYFINLYSINNKEFFKRFFKLMINIAPLKIISTLESIIPQLNNPLKVEPFISSLNNFKELGLSNSAYWIVQLKKFNTYIDIKDIDLENLILNKAHSHYIRLLNILLNNVDFIKHSKDPWLIFFKDLITIKESLEDGVFLIGERYQAEFIKNAIFICGTTNYSQNLIDKIAINALKKELMNKIKTPIHYFKDYLKLNNLKYKKDRIIYTNCNLDFLESLGSKVLTEEEYMDLKIKFENSQDIWLQDIIIKDGHIRNPLYNSKILDFITESKRRNENCPINCLDIIYINENCENIHEIEISKYNNQNFKELIIKEIDLYLNNKKEFNSIKNYLKLLFVDYESFNYSTYNAVNISSIFSNLSISIQEKIISILSIISINQLKEILIKNNEDKYLNIMIEKKINLKELFNYLSTFNKRVILRKLLATINCYDFIKESKSDIIITVLSNIGGLPLYYPLILELKNHKVKKIREICSVLIKTCNINKEFLSPFKIVDYGIYKMEAEKIINNKIGVSREAIHPKCIKETDSIKGEVGIYIGFRFTSANLNIVPKIFNHKVVVTHPKSKNNKEYIKTTWNQNGYSNSFIFLGWFFENEKELISGNYIFEIYDLSENLILEKTLYIY